MRLRHVLTFPIACSLALGCQVAPGRPPVAATPKPKASAATTAKPGGLQPGDQLRLLDAQAAKDAGKPLVTAQLIGKIRLISDNGAVLISDNGAAIVSNNGGRLIGKIRGEGNGLIGKIRNEGTGLIGKIRYQLHQAAPAPQEAYLAEARIEVLDAEGRVLAGPDGKPITAMSDLEGGYKLEADLPDESLLLRVVLDPSLGPDGQGGSLLAMLPKGEAKRELPIDTASSVGASYVLERLVEKRQAVFDRLPGAEAEALRGEVEAARGLLPVQPAYTREALAAAAEALQAKSPPVAARLERIRAILLAGQSDLGRGRLATDVTLAAPLAIGRDDAGALYVVEAGAFRVRKIGTDGRMTVHAGTGSGKAKVARDSIEPIGGMAMAPDGTLYLTQPYSGRVRKVAPDGTVSLVPMPPELGRVSGIALAEDGALWIGAVRSPKLPGGLYLVKDGVATPQAIAPGLKQFGYTSLAVAPDGTLYALNAEEQMILRRKPGEAAMSLFASGMQTERLSAIAVDKAGIVYLAESKGSRIVRYDANGVPTPVAGTGTAGHTGDGGPAAAALISQPSGMYCPPEGGLYFCDADGLVHYITPAGVLTTVAGTLSVRAGDATSLAINAPGGLAFDAKNQLILAETGSSTIKRLVGNRVEIVAGVFGGYGFAGDHGPAATAMLAAPANIAFRGDELIMVDSGNFAIRRIDALGTITSLVRRGGPTPDGTERDFDPMQTPMFGPVGLAIGPRGDIYWTDPQAGMIMRLRADGSRVDAVAGKYRVAGDSGNGGPARDALLKAPFGIAFGPDGDLYFADSANMVIRKIAGGEPTGTISTAVGVTALEAVGKLLEVGGRPPEEGIKATDAALAAPCTVAFDPDGNMYVAELGTSLSALGERPELAALLEELPPIGARIRQIKKDGTIRTIAGEGSQLLADPTGDEAMLYPLVIAFDKDGRLVIADGALNQIKMLPKGAF